MAKRRPPVKWRDGSSRGYTEYEAALDDIALGITEYGSADSSYIDWDWEVSWWSGRRGSPSYAIRGHACLSLRAAKRAAVKAAWQLRRWLLANRLLRET